jgi:predicted hydrocarbon binding protein
MFKRLKKELNIKIDEKEGHLFLGDKKKDLKLLMLRPIDIIEFSEFAGANADDILIWVGKTLGKDLIEKYFYGKDWSVEMLSLRKDVFLGILEGLALLGYGYLIGTFKKDHILVSNYNPLASEEKGNIMAKNLCLVTQGILNGILETLNFEVEGEEVECVLLDDERCVFKFDLLTEEIPEKFIDEEEKPEAISDFLSSL